MKQVFFILAALLAVINCSKQYTTREVIEKVKSKYLKEVLLGMEPMLDNEVQVFHYRCPGSPEKLRNAAMEFLICEHQLDDSLTICQEIQIISNCTKSLIQVAADCVPQHRREMPDLALKSLVSAAGYLCQKHGEDILELGNKCLWKNFSEKADQLSRSKEDSFKNCQKTVNTLGHQKNVTSSDICSFAIGLRSCTENFVELSNCKNLKTKNMVLGLYDAVVAPCKRINKL